MDNMSKSAGATETAFELSKDASKEFDIEIAKLQDNLLSIGQKLLPIVNEGLKLLNKLLGNNNTDNFTQDLIKASEELEVLKKREEKAIEVLTRHKKAFGETSKDIQKYENLLQMSRNAVNEQQKVVDALTEKVEGLGDATEKSTDKNEDNIETIKVLNEEYDNYLEKIKELQNAEKILGDEFDLTNESIKLTQETLIEL